MFHEETQRAMKPAFLEQYRGVKDRRPKSAFAGRLDARGSASMCKILKGVLGADHPSPNEILSNRRPLEEQLVARQSRISDAERRTHRVALRLHCAERRLPR